MIIDMKVMEEVKLYENVFKGGDTAFLRRAISKGVRIYSADHYNFVQIRQELTSSHTWEINKNDYLKNCKALTKKDSTEYILI